LGCVVEIQVWVLPLSANVKAIPLSLDEAIKVLEVQVDVVSVAPSELASKERCAEDSQHKYEEICDQQQIYNVWDRVDKGSDC
jgi:uncharacterized protein YoxC